MNTKNKRSGYIMIFTLMMIALLTGLVAYLANRSIPYISFTTIVIQREKAKLLALGGIQAALSQLAWAAAPEKEKKKKTAGIKEEAIKKPEEQDKQFLETILPYINRWQTVSLTKEKDGIEGEILFAISCEEGKVDINQIYDFEKKKFVGEGGKDEEDYKKIMQQFFGTLEKKIGGQKLFDSFATFLKNRKYKLNDVTELLTINAFEPFKNKLFYEPPQPGKEIPVPKKPTMFLTDIFTVWSGQKQVESWLLSDSMCGLLNLEQSKTGDTEKRKKDVKNWLENFKPSAKWEEDWDKMLAHVYGKKFNALPKFIKSLLATKFGPTVFSVLSYGKVEEVAQRFLAIIEKSRPSQKEDGRASVIIRKLYWL